MDRLYIPVIILHLSIVAKNVLLQRLHNYGVWNYWQQKLLYCMLYYMNWLTHDFWTRTGVWKFDRSHGAGTLSPSHWQQGDEQEPKPVGWMMCFLLMTFVLVQKLCVNIYIYIYIYIYMHFLYEFCYRTYIYIQQVCHSVLVKLHPSHSIGLYFWGVRSSLVECHFLFSLVHQLCIALWW